MPLGNGDPIASWLNQVTGNTVNGVQTNPSFQPTVDTGELLSGYQSIKFVVTRGLFFEDLLTGTTEATLFIVHKKAHPVLNGALWNAGGTSGSPTNYPDNDGIIRDGALAQHPRHVTVDPTHALDTPHIYSVRSKANQWTSRINNEILHTTSTNTYKDGQGGDFTLGINSVGDPYAGWVWLVAGVSRWLDDDEWQERIDAIALRYGMTL